MSQQGQSSGSDTSKPKPQEKTPPQAYGINLSGNMSGESLRKIFIAALSKVDDIKQVSFTSTIQKVVECVMALNSTPVKTVQVAWGEPIPADYSELVAIENSRVSAGTQSKLTTIMTLDNVSEEDAQNELARIVAEKNTKTIQEKNGQPNAKIDDKESDETNE